MEFSRPLLVRKTKNKGSEAVEKALAGFEEIIQDLNEALEETSDERIEAEGAVETAKRNRDHVEEILRKGENFLNGLRALLQG